jgi:hypothetical protein
MTLPAGFTPPAAARVTDGLGLADRLVLLHAWLHDSAAAVSGATRRDIEQMVNRYGVALTTAGDRWGRSAADLVCARSSAKGAAAAAIIANEAKRPISVRPAITTAYADGTVTGGDPTPQER